MSLDQSPDTLLTRILPAEPLEHESPAPALSQFKPWHLPRKQHVRKNQWGDALCRMIDNLPDRQVINYLCMPGEDLLDVEVLADVCRQKQRRLRYIGFDDAAGKRPRSIQRIAAEQILRQTDVVEDTSEVIPDAFASVARCDSTGFRHLRDRGSYDVVNLDMCDSFTSHPHAHNHDAVLALLNHQSHCRGDPWLLFLTTRAELERIQDGELSAYDACFRENAENSKEFCECLARVLSIANNSDTEAFLKQVKDRRRKDTGVSGRWLTLAIGKWLLGIMAQLSPWRVDLLSVWCYRTGLMATDPKRYAAGPPNLFSLAFRFEKIRQTRQDPAGLAYVSSPTGELNEGHLAKKMAACVENHTFDLDCYLQADPTLGDGLMAECISMLSVRNYSEPAYKRWMQGLPRVNYCPE